MEVGGGEAAARHDMNISTTLTSWETKRAIDRGPVGRLP